MNIHDMFESQQICPECGGPSFSDKMLAEKKDACYHKVRSRYKVWPSAYASGALVQCRKKGAANWGNKSKNESVNEANDLYDEIPVNDYDRWLEIVDRPGITRHWSKDQLHVAAASPSSGVVGEFDTRTNKGYVIRMYAERLKELFDPTQGYYKLADGQIVRAEYRTGMGTDAIPGSVDISPVDPKLMPTPIIGSAVLPWDKAPENVKSAIEKWVEKSAPVNEEDQYVPISMHSFNDDDWYEIDPATKVVVKQHSPRAFSHPLMKSEIKLPNGNLAVKGLKAKYMDLKRKVTNENLNLGVDKIDRDIKDLDGINEAIGSVELASKLFDALQEKYPDLVTRYGHEVVADAVLDVAEANDNFQETDDISKLVDDAIGAISGRVDNANTLRPSDEQMYEGDEEKSIGFVDPELERTLTFAKTHYAGKPDKQAAFLKFVQRSLKHAKETDAEQTDDIVQLRQEVNQIKAKLGISETRMYYAVAATPAAELRKEFGMRKDAHGWFLTESSKPKQVLDAERAFGKPRLIC